ncbi:hypothetical protein N0V84_002827 [Fusarium piperis]|uniref:DUF7908 domain-containing protein n=1 Tax=Fusarium piperis TaxID=1435070 RepID=A0A9W8WIG3_9HYPO|nr:hypothetical protein N0V84_002827 [Fusarium piperis]
MVMRRQLFHLALAGNILQAVATFENIELVQGSLCIIYLSTYLAPARTWAASLDPIESPAFIDRNGTSTSIRTLLATSLPDSASSVSLGSLTDIDNVATGAPSASDLLTRATVSRETSRTPTSNAASVTTTGAEVSGQAIILLVNEPEDTRKRQQRAVRGFINNGNTAGFGSCSDAGIFSLASGQLLDAGDPIYYSASEDYKQLTPQGEPPVGAITTTFTNSGGSLQFINPLLPNDQAGFCQDPQTGEIFITLTSQPPGCVPVKVAVYLGNIYFHLASKSHVDVCQ